MNKNTNNKEYWNEYVTYWEKRVEETNTGKEKKDITASDDILFRNLLSLEIKNTDRFLDFGCGTCRTFEKFKSLYPKENYFGVDISEVALKKALEKYSDLKPAQLMVSDGRIIPYEDGMFDKVFCYGVLDCCDQECTIAELIRVTKVGGLIWITGKNYHYCDDDMLAYEAELKARNNHFPNHFTKVSELKKQLQENGVKVVNVFYFQKRGDAATFRFTLDQMEQFYEWAMLLQKVNDDKIELIQIALEHSYACRNVL